MGFADLAEDLLTGVLLRLGRFVRLVVAVLFFVVVVAAVPLQITCRGNNPADLVVVVGPRLVVSVQRRILLHDLIPYQEGKRRGVEARPASDDKGMPGARQK